MQTLSSFTPDAALQIAPTPRPSGDSVPVRPLPCLTGKRETGEEGFHILETSVSLSDGRRCFCSDRRLHFAPLPDGDEVQTFVFVFGLNLVEE